MTTTAGLDRAHIDHSARDLPRPGHPRSEMDIRAVATTPRQPSAFERWARSAVLSRMAGLSSGRIELHEAGTLTVVGAGHDRIRIDIHDPSAWSDLAAGGTVGAGAAYTTGLWTCPDLVGLVRLLVRDRSTLDGLEGGFARLLAPLRRLWHWSRSNTKSGSRVNIAAHYDLGNDFFALWLDPSMTYSSAYWQREDQTLAQAQEAKIDRICRLLALGQQDHLLEIGSGWGALAIHAARQYGCRVTTTTISRKQWEFARARVAAAGLEGRIDVRLEDYRELRGVYDKLVSVEMIEAVGHRYYAQYFKTCARMLKCDGAMVMQAITIAERQFAPALKAVDFIQRYVFPGCCIPSLGALTTAMGRSSDLDVVEVHDLTNDYARTLSLWRQRFNQCAAEVAVLGHGEDFRRLWNFYLAYCEGGFAERALGCAQILLARSGWRAGAQTRLAGA